MFVFSYFPVSIISNGQQNRPHSSFIYFFQPKKSSCCCSQKQNRGHHIRRGGGPAERSHRMLLSQAEKKVASMARELDALTAFERQKFFSIRPREGDGWGRRAFGSGGRGVVNWD